MSWKRRTRAVAWGTLLMLACSLAMPTASAAFPIKLWMLPQIGDPDGPSGSILIRLRYRASEFGLSFYSIGSSGFLLILPLGSTDQGTRFRGAR